MRNQILRLAPVFVGAIVAMTSGPGAAAAQGDLLFVTAQRGTAEIWQVDVASGDRTLLDLTDYPAVIKVERGAVAPSGVVLLSAVNAAQGRVVVAFDPVTRTLSGVSGDVLDADPWLRGAGPGFAPGIGGLAVGPWGVFYVLRERAGPMRVDVATGNRTVVSQSADPPAGSGVPLDDPVDITVLADGRLLLAERLGGLVAVEPLTGLRSVVHVFPDIVEARHRLGVLADGRVVHLVSGGAEVAVFDRSLSARTVLSGARRGSGPAIGALADLAVGPGGHIYVLDTALGAIVAVDPATGDRRIVSGGPEGRGSGPPLPPAGATPFLARFAVTGRRPLSGRGRPSRLPEEGGLR